MSNEEIRINNKVKDVDLGLAALNAAVAAGCTCDPEIRLYTRRGYTDAQILHDDWCPVLKKIARHQN